MCSSRSHSRWAGTCSISSTSGNCGRLQHPSRRLPYVEWLARTTDDSAQRIIAPMRHDCAYASDIAGPNDSHESPRNYYQHQRRTSSNAGPAATQDQQQRRTSAPVRAVADSDPSHGPGPHAQRPRDIPRDTARVCDGRASRDTCRLSRTGLSHILHYLPPD